MIALLAQGLALHLSERELTFASAHQHDSSLLGGASDNAAPVAGISRPPATPVKLIVDTDMGGGACQDVDDVGALCLAHALADRGEAELLAVMQNTAPPAVAGVISVINNYYGRNVPIGAYRGSGVLDSRPATLDYVESVLVAFPSPIRNNGQATDAVVLYRQVLAAAEPRSVTISSIGLLTNLEGLLKSEPDQHSPLSGIDLVAEKVALLAVMAGKYPHSPQPAKWGGAECNACGCYNYASDAAADTAAGASSYVVDHWPHTVRMVFLGFEVGANVRTGAVLETCAKVENPCRHAYMNYKEENSNQWNQAEGGRPSWDPLTTLFAVRGASGEGLSDCTDCNGVNRIDAKGGNNAWAPGRASNQSYLLLESGKVAQQAVDSLLCQPRCGLDQAFTRTRTELDGGKNEWCFLYNDDSAKCEAHYVRQPSTTSQEWVAECIYDTQGSRCKAGASIYACAQ
eukprot:CAMPEP_0196687984 /NCGR_PEP_ID=MMETSP1090-20130531/15735_1 /TAXON_ID=37098 /ORGANISM="Isochrysis sp, Strain CCMP1244" /LENGTH=457 /DNA_ID=CAMNT_0042026833 /DNA_START=42 /DNA_END=1415 /DNA_ORIENTATION=+